MGSRSRAKVRVARVPPKTGGTPAWALPWRRVATNHFASSAATYDDDSARCSVQVIDPASTSCDLADTGGMPSSWRWHGRVACRGRARRASPGESMSRHAAAAAGQPGCRARAATEGDMTRPGEGRVDIVYLWSTPSARDQPVRTVRVRQRSAISSRWHGVVEAGVPRMQSVPSRALPVFARTGTTLGWTSRRRQPADVVPPHGSTARREPLPIPLR